VKIVQIPNGQFVENCYLVIDEASRECAVIDPGEEAGLILRRISEAGVRPVAVWITHAHLDHVMGVPRLSRETGAPIYLHPADRELYDHVIQQGLAFGIRVESLPPPDREFVPGESVQVGAVGFTVRHAPGHSPGSVCLVGDGVVFTGDVLFAGSIGRTDLPGADFDTLIRSIERELLVLPDSTKVYSGHGPETTVGRERGTNPFLIGVHRVA
jgi:glyoxylase-like metal-dependent hydrolase (beta-lactamase superfamily II)